MVWYLCRATTDLVCYLGPQPLVAEIINKLELVYDTMTSFDILMQHFYKLQPGKTAKVTLYITQLEGALNAVWQGYLMMLSASEVQQLLRDQHFHGLHKQLHNSMCYLYDDKWITYPQLMTAAQNAESEQED